MHMLNGILMNCIMLSHHSDVRDYPKGHSDESHYAKCHSDEIHYAKCDSDESHYAKCHSDECRGTGKHDWKNLIHH